LLNLVNAEVNRYACKCLNYGVQSMEKVGQTGTFEMWEEGAVRCTNLI
jgi:hypothetical protein